MHWNDQLLLQRIREVLRADREGVPGPLLLKAVYWKLRAELLKLGPLRLRRNEAKPEKIALRLDKPKETS